jgi:hypothetical protein
MIQHGNCGKAKKELRNTQLTYMLSNNSIIHFCQLQEHFQLQKSGGYQVDNLEAGTKLWDVFKVKSAPEQKQENKCATLSINKHATQSQHECFPSATSIVPVKR